MIKRNFILKLFEYLLISVFIILIDQLTKLWLYGKSCSLIGDILWLESPTLNTGAAFNMLNNNTLLLVITLLFSLVMIYFICSQRVIKSKFLKISLSILLGGTIGNIIDRIFWGGVRDFIYFKSINFAIFNFADIFVNIGVYLIVGYLIYFSFFKKDNNRGKREKLSKKENESKLDNDANLKQNISKDEK